MATHQTSNIGMSTNTEIVEKKVDIEQALSRARRPLDATNLNLEVYGVYSLPDTWKSRVEDPNEQLYTYEIDMCGMNLKNAKVQPKELTEEEKAEMEAAKNVKGKAAPAKDAKGKKEEEPSAQELERIERERKEKEEKERKIRDEWEALDEETRFNRTKEDIFKEPAIKFQNIFAQRKIEQLQQELNATPETEELTKKEIQEQIQDLQGRLQIGNVVCEKQSFELVEFEEMVQNEKGCWLVFKKLPPPEEEILDPKAAAAKKAPPKGGKGAPVEDLKPTYGRAWISFEDLLLPGAIEIKQRVFLETCPPLVKRPGDDGVEKYFESEEYEQVFEGNRTYVYLKLTLSDPITPTIPEQPEPQPHEIVPVKQFIRWPFSKDPTDDFAKQITLAVESLAKEYYNMFQNELEQEAQGGKTDSELSESFEERKKEYLYEINTSGKYHILKEKLKKTIVRIVKEHFKKTGSIRGLYKDERDHFYSQLYAYLVEQMRRSVQVLVERKKNELHENVSVTAELAEKERDHLISSNLGETLPERYKRLAEEAEYITNNIQEAEQYMIKLMNLQEGDPQAMLDMGKFYLRINKPDKADEYLRDAYSFQIKNNQVAQIYAAFLIQQGRSKEAYVILNKLTQDTNYKIFANLLISIGYDMDSDTIMAQKYRAIAFVTILREQGALPQTGELQYHKPVSQPPIKLQPGQVANSHEPVGEPTNRVESAPAFTNIKLSTQDQDNLYLSLISFLVQEGLNQLAQRALGNIQNTDNTQYLQYFAKVSLSLKNYNEAENALTQLLAKEPSNLESQSMLGHLYFYSKKLDKASEAYLKAMRLEAITQQEQNDQYVYQRLGSILISQKKWEDSKIIFTQCAEKYKNAFSFLNLGIAYLNLDDFESADRVLSQANILDPQKGEIWGYLTLLILNRTSDIHFNSAFQTQNEAIKLKINNVDLLKSIAFRWKQEDKIKEAREALEQAMKARASKDSIKHQKKCDEFLRTVKDTKDEHEIKTKFRDIMVKSNCLKENDELAQELINVIANS